MTAETGEDLAHLLGVEQRLRRLRLHERDERDPVRPDDHQRVVRVSDDSRQFRLEDVVEDRVDGRAVEVEMHAGMLAIAHRHCEADLTPTAAAHTRPERSKPGRATSTRVRSFPARSHSR